MSSTIFPGYLLSRDVLIKHLGDPADRPLAQRLGQVEAQTLGGVVDVVETRAANRERALRGFDLRTLATGLVGVIGIGAASFAALTLATGALSLAVPLGLAAVGASIFGLARFVQKKNLQAEVQSDRQLAADVKQWGQRLEAAQIVTPSENMRNYLLTVHGRQPPIS